MKIKKLSAIFLAVWLCFLVGCGGGNSTNEQPSGTNSTTNSEASTNTQDPEPSETDELVIVWAAHSFSHDHGVKAMQILPWLADRVNANGGVNGQNVRVEFVDSGNDQQSYIDGLLLATEVEGVDAIIGTFYSQYAIAASQYILDEKIPTINICTNYELGQMNPYYYMNRGIDTGMTYTFAQIGMDNGITHPAIINMNSSSGYNQAAMIREHYENNGLSVAIEVAYDADNTNDYTPYVLQIINSDCDGVFVVSTADAAGQNIISLLRQYDFQYPVAGVGTLCATKFATLCGPEVVDGMIGYSEYAPTIEKEANADFLDMWYEGCDFDGQNLVLGWADAALYDIFNLFCHAAELGGGNDRDSINAGMKLIENFPGAMSTYSWHDDQSLANEIYSVQYTGELEPEVLETVAVVH